MRKAMEQSSDCISNRRQVTSITTSHGSRTIRHCHHSFYVRVSPPFVSESCVRTLSSSFTAFAAGGGPFQDFLGT